MAKNINTGAKYQLFWLAEKVSKIQIGTDRQNDNETKGFFSKI
jgi:hypothetical protein